MPEIELQELAKIYEKRGVSKETTLRVATELTEHDALAAHAHDELGINEITRQSLYRRLLLRLVPLLLEHCFLYCFSYSTY